MQPRELCSLAKAFEWRSKTSLKTDSPSSEKYSKPNLKKLRIRGCQLSRDSAFWILAFPFVYVQLFPWKLRALQHARAPVFDSSHGSMKETPDPFPFHEQWRIDLQCIPSKKICRSLTREMGVCTTFLFCQMGTIPHYFVLRWAVGLGKRGL